ncbi:MAG: Fpg/Nei family DNA glycosylase [Nocardioidaceae bacterium]|nr:Fpg/Nei family DNA glycosylase [Nocardioidaceae bacterium]
MPEGDTVWRTAHRLDAALRGRVLTTAEFRVPAYAEVDLTGQRVVETVSRGKHLLTRLDQMTLHTHLKMEGSWHLYKVGSRWRSPGFQARVVLANDVWQAVGFRLGVVDLVPRDQEHTVVGHLGPDVLGPDWSPADVMRRLEARPDRPIGEALLDQRNLAGVGNLYKCEVCFVLGVHPLIPVRDVEVLPQLLDKVHRMLVANKDRAQQTTTGNVRRGEQNWVYARAGRPCLRCGTSIAEQTFATTDDLGRGVTPSDPPDPWAPGPTTGGGPRRRGAASAVGRPSQARRTYWCPTCQPAPD